MCELDVRLYSQKISIVIFDHILNHWHKTPPPSIHPPPLPEPNPQHLTCLNYLHQFHAHHVQQTLLTNTPPSTHETPRPHPHKTLHNPNPNSQPKTSYQKHSTHHHQNSQNVHKTRGRRRICTLRKKPIGFEARLVHTILSTPDSHPLTHSHLLTKVLYYWLIFRLVILPLDHLFTS